MGEVTKFLDRSEDVLPAEMHGVEAYISEDYARAERDKLWRKCWLQAGRLEDIPEVGNFITYDILDDSVLIVRTAPDRIKAFANVCTHRGRRLGEFKVDTWGGFIWINIDPQAEPLRDYLEPAATMLDPFELQNMRPRWRYWTIFDCNWKVALEAFDETYHTQGTHPALAAFGDWAGWGRQQGRHSHIGYDVPKAADPGLGENRGKLRLGSGDPRISTAEMQKFIWEGVNTNTTKTLVDVAQTLPEVLPEGTPAAEVSKYWLETSRATDEAQGVVWPRVDLGHVAASGTAWQIFPNQQIGHAVNNMLCYKARPCGYNPDKCFFEVAVYQLWPEGGAPETEWTYLEPGQFPEILLEDFSNMAAVQQGMKNAGFRGNIPNPKNEGAVTAFHRNLAKYMGVGAPRPLK